MKVNDEFLRFWTVGRIKEHTFFGICHKILTFYRLLIVKITGRLINQNNRKL